MISSHFSKHIFVQFIFVLSFFSFAAQGFCLKISGNYFINCKNVIMFGNHSVMQMEGDIASGQKVNFDIYSSTGILDATLKGGKFTGKNAAAYSIASTDKGFVIEDKRDHHEVMRVEGHQDNELGRMVDYVWAQLYLPDSSLFQCSPETSNVPFLQMMKGNTFSNSETAILLEWD